MLYISPFHYLTQDIIQNNFVDISKIKLVRKQLLAEIELSETQSIIVNNRELTKFNIITLFDALNDTKSLNIHAEIYKDKPLLNFLEKGVFTSQINLFSNPNLSNDTTINFISTYYKKAAIVLVNDAINKKNVEIFNYFFNVIHLLTNEDKYEFYEYITKKMTMLCTCINELEKKIQNKNKITITDINNLGLDNIIQILNALPNDFDKLREDVAYNFNSLGCELMNNLYYNYAKILFKKVQFLVCSEYIKDLLLHNLEMATYRGSSYFVKILRLIYSFGIVVKEFLILIASYLIDFLFFIFKKIVGNNRMELAIKEYYKEDKIFHSFIGVIKILFLSIFLFLFFYLYVILHSGMRIGF